MASNDKIILDQVLEQKQQSLAPTLSASEYFEVFTAEQVLKDFDLSYEEIESGIVGDGGDGGIDGAYVFVNGELIQEDSDLSGLKKHVNLELVLLQAKTGASFSESAVEKLTSVTEDLLDLAHKVEDYASVYNEGVREVIGRFRKAHALLASRFPAIRIAYYCASKGSKIHPNVERKARLLEDKVKKLFSAAECSFTFLGAADLLTLARRAPRTSHSLTLAETPISSSGDVGFVCLVRLRDYYSFITDKDVLLRHIFEANVRDYQGSTQVNDEIQDSLTQSTKEDFWWLNNGITVIASNATQSGKTLTIEDPQIVNGLQTSTEVYNYFRQEKPKSEDRNLLVRVIVPAHAASRDRIIKATNSQTSIQPASLRATDKIHRDIEEYLKPYGLCYDRRKNSYKNEGTPIERIVGIPYMAQAVMSVVQQRPDNARSRPSSLLKRDEDYRNLFSTEAPIGVYYFCAALLKRVEAFLRDETTLTQKDRGNIRFHVGMRVAAVASGKATPSADDLAAMKALDIEKNVIQQSVDAVLRVYRHLGATDVVSKSADFLTAVRVDLEGELKEGGQTDLPGLTSSRVTADRS